MRPRPGITISSESEACVVPSDRAVLGEGEGFSFTLTVPQDATPDDVLKIMRFLGDQAFPDVVEAWFGAWLGAGPSGALCTWGPMGRAD